MGTAVTLEELAKRVTEQRQGTGRTRFSEEVWSMVKTLRRKYSIREISLATGLTNSHISLKSKKRGGTFCELSPRPVLISRDLALLELKRADGSELKIRLNSSQGEILELISGFLR